MDNVLPLCRRYRYSKNWIRRRCSFSFYNGNICELMELVTVAFAVKILLWDLKSGCATGAEPNRNIRRHLGTEPERYRTKR